MKRWFLKRGFPAWIVGACLLGPLFPASGTVAAQEARQVTVGVSAGPGAVQIRGRAGSWDFGPFFGGRAEWGNRRSAAALGVDVQPFQAEGTYTADEFRAIYLLPSYVIGSGSRRIRLGIGLGIFDFAAGTGADGPAVEGTKVGIVAGASGSMRLGRSSSIELGWKRINNVEGLRANVWLLRLVRVWRL